MSKTGISTIKRLQGSKRVDEISDERSMGNGLIVTMAKGWSFDPTQDNRVAGADTISELKALISRAIPFAGPFDE